MKEIIFKRIAAIILIITLIFISDNILDVRSVPAAYINTVNENIVILDAGHGGEDGGTMGSDGTLEKDINLFIAEKISDYFDIFGISYIMTRTSDAALGDINLDTIKQRKVSDIKTRFNIVNSNENSCLLSIHQNFFPIEKYKGTQVFYSPSVSGSDVWAQCIQENVSFSLQPDNKRKIKPSGDNIYLLHKAIRPSVMVECGFLSNNEELNLLNDSNYQSRLAYFICKGTIQYFNN